MHDPSVHAILHACGLMTGLDQRSDEIEQRQLALREVCNLGRPIVHLNVHIGVIVAVPRRLDLVGPYTLQVRGHSSRARRRYEQVTPVLEHQLAQMLVICALLYPLETLVGGYILRLVPSQTQRHAVEIWFILLQMCFQKRRI